jgi:signal transduction histidine kinase
VMTFGFDITHEVRANEALRASEEQVRALNDELTEAVRARDTFLSIASHELRTPLTTLLLQTQSLLAREPDGSLRPLPEDQLVRRLALVQRQGRRLERLVEELLDVTQVTSGRLEIDVTEVDVRAVAEEVVTRAADDAERAGCTLVLRGDPRAVVRSDRRHLERVLDNLVTNAIKYGDGRPIEVRVEATGEGARVHVEDQGIGIDPDHQARIWSRFERAVSGRHYAGLGLGLWIVREIMDALGGRVRVRSDPGRGSVFTVELPREPR